MTSPARGPRLVTVEVTADDIKNGIPRRCFLCPIAIALRRALGREDAMAGPQNLGTVASGEWIDTPMDVRRWMRAFDDGKSVEPFVFTFSVPR